MKTDTLLHRLKPDGYKEAAIVTSMRHLINEMQELAGAAYTKIVDTHQPTDIIGTGHLEDWPGHEPLQLEVYPTLGGRYNLHDIRVRGASVSEWLPGNLWAEAEQWLCDNLDRETSDSESRVIARMDRCDELAERSA